MSGHTPGPWVWNGDNQLWGGENEGTEILMAKDDGRTWGFHSAIIEHHFDQGIAKANARLIAAAPDLLAALEKARDFIRLVYAEAYAIDDQLMQQMDEVIKKARGEK